MSNKKLSSVEWLFNQIPSEFMEEYLEKAKELHKQEIINAVDGFPLSKRGLEGEEYYEQLFNQEEK